MLVVIDIVISLMGLYAALLLYYRMFYQRSLLFNSERVHPLENKDLVSVIIPCRNEEDNIPVLLESLRTSSYENSETIVVDDNSSDDTAKVSEAFGVSLLRLKSKESGWKGKPWACWKGSEIANGEYLLFTDADTSIDSSAISRSVKYMREKELDLMSTVPFHKNERMWEKLLGVFQLFLLIVTKPYASEIDPRQLYGIGQYLIFKRDAYHAIDGHASVKTLLVDDLTLINVLIAKGMKYGVYPGEPLYFVRMYDSFQSFIQGWKRHIRGGVRTLNLMMVFESFALFSILIHSLRMNNPLIDIPAVLVGIPCITVGQKKIGNFSTWGVVLFPFSFFVFVWVNILAAYDTILKKDYTWKNRNYSPDSI